MVGGAATVFQVYNISYAARISTNVLDTSGRRAVGTPLTDNVYDVAVKQNTTYYGRRDLFGKKYVTAYEPIHDPGGEVIGVLFVGTEEGQTLDVVKKSIRDTIVRDNGYMFVVDSMGTVLVHPTREGDNWSNESYVREMFAKEKGAITHDVDGKWVVDVYQYYELLDWYIVSRAALTEACHNDELFMYAISSLEGFYANFAFEPIPERSLPRSVQERYRLASGDLDGAEVLSMHRRPGR